MEQAVIRRRPFWARLLAWPMVTRKHYRLLRLHNGPFVSTRTALGLSRILFRWL